MVKIVKNVKYLIMIYLFIYLFIMYVNKYLYKKDYMTNVALYNIIV